MFQVICDGKIKIYYYGKDERNRVIFTHSAWIDGEVYSTHIWEEDVRTKYKKDYFDMTSKEKKECEDYFCENNIF